MKIVFLCRLFYPHIGGVEKHVMEISKRLTWEGHQVTIITEQYNSQLPLQEEIDNICVYRIVTGRENRLKKFRIWREIWRLRNMIEESDIIHCHDVFFWYLPFRFLYPHKPVYTTFHGYESYPITEKAINMRKIAEKLSRGNICIGDFIKKWYGTKPTFVSYGAVDIGAEKEKSTTKNKYKEESAVFIGRLDEQTGFLTYLQAFEEIKKKFPKFHFAVVGNGKYRDKLSDEIEFLGWQKKSEQYLKQYHFAFVSRYLSILEAFAAKKLVFAVYDNPVKEDYLRITPFADWIIIEKDPKKLAEKVMYYLKYPNEEQKIVGKEYSWVKTQTWTDIVLIYIKLWKKSL